MIIFLAVSTAFLIGFLITPIIILILKKMELMDRPGGRKIHSGFIPSMGGISFVAATFVAVLSWLDGQFITEIRFLLAAFGLMFFVGLRDDMVNMSAFQKLAGQFIAAYLVVVMADIRLTGLYGFMGIYDLPIWISYFISFFTILVLTNSFNLIDGIDGLAGSISLVTFLFLGWWFYDVGLTSYATFSLILVGAVLSFLVYNWHPAKIFMGDTGSLSLGFALAVLTVLFIDKNGTMASFEGWKFNAPIASGVALLIIPIYDTSRIFIKRTLNGKSPMEPDKSHVHHFLLRMGLRHDQVTLTLTFVKCCFIGLIFLASNLNDYVLLPLVILTAVILGAKLDSITLKRVKKRNKNSPPILSKRAKKKSIHKAEIQEGVIDKAKLSDN
ncbi:UDP-N-acetylmuramyl pentapeptide phosphotransferase/UDP-N-acetylglucosamine-1-phosphate transferase [Aquiflexum balticum DSM 16537]|uniref:UDP-N-acetylmuramyl pentapeptide phosphotransferase/UDP-N-acetylglucosamine-1-phosphate transferase n=1 Tax=Aquiflexum balticum DSM 16537 TaxID=758820 RepID=A0A1W2H799_9BACT|nr:MraY family glycosyltransferase [Aquiflexum balticum]SMD44634.1 UDP-N-acetylmuramyl pentapeptide phosphotransferase/UDP-N-acetylglucosamine-1-phosphate transferase [Aquiflexum balticum DSM 16537]